MAVQFRAKVQNQSQLILTNTQYYLMQKNNMNTLMFKVTHYSVSLKRIQGILPTLVVGSIHNYFVDKKNLFLKTSVVFFLNITSNMEPWNGFFAIAVVLPWVFMLGGAPVTKYRSEACFSTMTLR